VFQYSAVQEVLSFLLGTDSLCSSSRLD
jgi:hypothetical protein